VLRAEVTSYFCVNRDNGQGDVIVLGKIAISTTNSIEYVYHVQGLGYNLLSVSQLCEKDYNCLFTHEGVTISRREDPLLSLRVIYALLCGFHKSEGGP
jgi:hypothetical protein